VGQRNKPGWCSFSTKILDGMLFQHILPAVNHNTNEEEHNHPINAINNQDTYVQYLGLLQSRGNGQLKRRTGIIVKYQSSSATLARCGQSTSRAIARISLDNTVLLSSRIIPELPEYQISLRFLDTLVLSSPPLLSFNWGNKMRQSRWFIANVSFPAPRPRRG